MAPLLTGAGPASAASLCRTSVLMDKYHDVPMDYVDATLVALGEELGCKRVFTLDVRGFSACRLDGRKAFEMQWTEAQHLKGYVELIAQLNARRKMNQNVGT